MAVQDVLSSPSPPEPRRHPLPGLKRLSERVQVLSVTHAPQVAARAATHLLISKGPAADGSEKIATRVATMAQKDRTEEIARMLAGASVTEEARAAAKRLLAGNG